MVNSPFSWFVGSVPNVGYRLYRLTNGGGPGATLTLQATVNAPWSPPRRGALQPGVNSGLTPTGGEIAGGAWFDGRSVWFIHEIDALGHPTVLYGNVDTITNRLSVGLAKRSDTSDDVNPSLAVGVAPAGPVVYLNWLFTDPPAGFAGSLMTDGLTAGQPVTNLIGTGNLYLAGAVTNTGFLFGGYSTTTVDVLRATNGGCAVGVQQYFIADGSWRTRIARLGACPAQ
jgi:hypothetical protein